MRYFHNILFKLFSSFVPQSKLTEGSLRRHHKHEMILCSSLCLNFIRMKFPTQVNQENVPSDKIQNELSDNHRY